MFAPEPENSTVSPTENPSASKSTVPATVVEVKVKLLEAEAESAEAASERVIVVAFASIVSLTVPTESTLPGT